MSQFSVITNDFVNVFISSNITSFTSEKKFDKSLTIADLKSKLELITGGNSGSMHITAFTKEDKLICEISDPNAMLTLRTAQSLKASLRTRPMWRYDA